MNTPKLFALALSVWICTDPAQIYAFSDSCRNATTAADGNVKLIFIESGNKSSAALMGRSDINDKTAKMLLKCYQEYKKRASGKFFADAFDAGRFEGVVKAAVNYGQNVYFRIPVTVTHEQLCEIVGKFIENNPKFWNEVGAVVCVLAIADAFPLN